MHRNSIFSSSSFQALQNISLHSQSKQRQPPIPQSVHTETWPPSFRSFSTDYGPPRSSARKKKNRALHCHRAQKHNKLDIQPLLLTTEELVDSLRPSKRKRLLLDLITRQLRLASSYTLLVRWSLASRAELVQIQRRS